MSDEDTITTTSKEVINLACTTCGGRFPFGLEEQDLFEKRQFNPPKRCHNCRLLKKLNIFEKMSVQEPNGQAQNEEGVSMNENTGSLASNETNDMKLELERQRLQLTVLRAQVSRAQGRPRGGTGGGVATDGDNQPLLCRSYFKTGNCRFGVRCRYLHMDPPSRTVSSATQNSNGDSISHITPPPIGDVVNVDEAEFCSGGNSSLSDGDYNGGDVPMQQPTQQGRSVPNASRNILQGTHKHRNRAKQVHIRPKIPLAASMGFPLYSCDGRTGYDNYGVGYPQQQQVRIPYPQQQQTDGYGCSYAYPMNSGSVGYFDTYGNGGQYPSTFPMPTGGGYNTYGAPTFCAYQPQYTELYVPTSRPAPVVATYPKKCSPPVVHAVKDLNRAKSPTYANREMDVVQSDSENIPPDNAVNIN